MCGPKQSRHLVYLARLGDDADVVAAADKMYGHLTDMKVAVLYDDRNMRPGEKFADADLMGIPYRLVVSSRLSRRINTS